MLARDVVALLGVALAAVAPVVLYEQSSLRPVGFSSLQVSHAGLDMLRKPPLLQRCQSTLPCVTLELLQVLATCPQRITPSRLDDVLLPGNLCAVTCSVPREIARGGRRVARAPCSG